MARGLPRRGQHVEGMAVFNFLIGLAIGWLAGSWYSNNHDAALPVEEMRKKAARALEESERLVQQSKRDLQAAVAGKDGDRPKRSRRAKRPPRND